MPSTHFLSKWGGAKLQLSIAVLGLLVAAAGSARAQTLTTLYSFTGAPNDGSTPSSGVILDAEGNLYGTTSTGGPYDYCYLSGGCGILFKLTPQGNETVLHNFGTRGSAFRMTDGLDPSGSLMFDGQGNLYGTTYEGGTSWIPPAYGIGTAYEWTASGREKVLHSFTGYTSDGEHPESGVVMDAQGNLYGTTYDGGTYGGGTVFKVAPDGTETVIHNFSGCQTDGFIPSSGLVFDAQGNLYGTTSAGGYAGSECYEPGDGWGTIFEITPDGTETIIFSFYPSGVGFGPGGSLMFDAQGNLYGTTYNGGYYGGNCVEWPGGCGTVYKLAPDGTQTLVYAFTGTDGDLPNGGLVMDAQGNLYGTTYWGGNNYSGGYNTGTAFEVTPDGTESVLYNFCSQENCADGANPIAGLAFDAQGNLYGTTTKGGGGPGCGGYGCGTVFRLTP